MPFAHSLVAELDVQDVEILGLDVALLHRGCRARTLGYLQVVVRCGKGHIFAFRRIKIAELLLGNLEVAHALRHDGIFGCHSAGHIRAGHTGVDIGFRSILLKLVGNRRLWLLHKFDVACTGDDISQRCGLAGAKLGAVHPALEFKLTHGSGETGGRWLR